MRLLFTALRAGRAFSRGVRATPAAARPPVMVPLSVLEWAREDAKAAREDAKAAREDAKVLSAREAQRSDERAAHEAQRSDERAAHEAQRSDELIKALEQLGAFKLATALCERDVALGKVSARALMEEALAEAWRAWGRLDAEAQEQMGAAVKKPPSAVTDQLKALLGFPGVAAYLQVAEEDNGLARGVLAKSAASLYPALCVPLHARAAGAQVEAGGAADRGLLRHWGERPHRLCGAGGLWRAQRGHVPVHRQDSARGAARAAPAGPPRHAGADQGLCQAARCGGDCGAGRGWRRRALWGGGGGGVSFGALGGRCGVLLRWALKEVGGGWGTARWCRGA